MSAILGGLSTAFINALLAVLSKIVAQPVFESVLTKLAVYSLEKLASMTKTTLDDEIVAEIVARLEGPKPAEEAPDGG